MFEWLMVRKSEMSFLLEEGFLKVPDEPHYVVNQANEPAVLLVTFASAEGLPNLIRIQP